MTTMACTNAGLVLTVFRGSATVFCQ